MKTQEIKDLQSELKEWQSKEVVKRFEVVNSYLPSAMVKELKMKIKKLKRGEDV